MKTRMTLDPARLPPELRHDFEAITERFEEAWSQGERPDIAEFLPRDNDHLRGFVLWELVHVDLELRARRGETPTSAEYLAAFPELNSDKAFVDSLHGMINRLELSQLQGGTSARPVTLGNYLLLKKIGGGGMGQVFLARHKRMDRDVAVKLLSSAMANDPAAIARFEREVRVASKIIHPNIVTAFDADQANRVHFLVMEYVDGLDLAAFVKKHGQASVDQAVNFILQAAQGLEAAHKTGIIHRDIKPSNLLLNREGIVKVLDMGLARMGQNDDPSQESLTATGTAMGTVDYMAPEQAEDTKSADERADIYSLGCSLYFLLTGKPAYESNSYLNKVLAHRIKPIPSLRAARPDVPELLEAIFEKMVAKNVDDRYQSMGEVIAELRRLPSINDTLPIARQSTRFDVGKNSNTTTAPPILSQPVTLALVSQPEPVTQLRVGTREKWLAWIGVGLLGMALLALIVFTLPTKDGTLVVDVGQPVSTVQVPNAPRKIEVSQKGPMESDSRLPIPGDPDRDAAEMALSKGGSVVVSLKSASRWNLLPPITRLEDLPRDPFVVIMIRLEVPGAKDADLAKLSGLNELWQLQLTGPEITNNGLRHLRSLSGLTQISFHATNVTESGLEQLAALPSLFSVAFSESNPIDNNLKSLAKLPHLQQLGVKALTARQIPLLSSLPRLREVLFFKDELLDNAVIEEFQKQNPHCRFRIAGRLRGKDPHRAVMEQLRKKGAECILSTWSEKVSTIPAHSPLPEEPFHVGGIMFPVGSAVDDDDLRLMDHFMGLSSVKIFGGAAVTDAGIAHLAHCPGLRNLTVSGTQISDEALESIGQLRILQQLWIDGAVISPAAIAKLQQASPNCLITRYAQPVAATPSTARKPLAFEMPGFDAWVKQVATKSPEQQVIDVAKKLQELNPGFDGIVIPTIDFGVVTRINFVTDHVTDISPVRALAGLNALECCGSSHTWGGEPANGILSDLSPLKGLGLTILWCGWNRALSDLTPLAGLSLRELSFHSTAVNDLKPLRAMKLTSIYFPWAPVADLSPLTGMPLDQLDFAGTLVSDLRPLSGMPLTVLWFNATQISDLAPLKGMALTKLGCTGTKVTDISALQGMKLAKLSCNYSQIQDLSPLKGMPITELELRNSQISDLSPLDGMALNLLWIDDTSVADLSPLEGMKLKDIQFSPSKVTKGMQVIRQMDTIQTIGFAEQRWPADQFWKKYDAGEFGKATLILKPHTDFNSPAFLQRMQ